MNNEEMAKIFYVIVHDFSDDIIKGAIAQKKENKTTYRDHVADINNWAYENKFSTIEKHSYNILSRMNVAGV